MGRYTNIFSVISVTFGSKCCENRSRVFTLLSPGRRGTPPSFPQTVATNGITRGRTDSAFNQTEFLNPLFLLLVHVYNLPFTLFVNYFFVSDAICFMSIYSFASPLNLYICIYGNIANVVRYLVRFNPLFTATYMVDQNVPKSLYIGH